MKGTKDVAASSIKDTTNSQHGTALCRGYFVIKFVSNKKTNTKLERISCLQFCEISQTAVHDHSWKYWLTRSLSVSAMWRHCRQAAEVEVAIIRCRQSALPAYQVPVLYRRPVSHRMPVPTLPARARLPRWVELSQVAAGAVVAAAAEASAVLCSGQPCCCAASWWPSCPQCLPFPAQRMTSNLTPLSSSTFPPPSNSVCCFPAVFMSVHSTYRLCFMS